MPIDSYNGWFLAQYLISDFNIFFDPMYLERIKVKCDKGGLDYTT